jgi:AraC-like DNA-binding protein
VEREAIAGTVSSEMLRTLAFMAASVGLPPPAFCERFAIDPGLLADPELRVPVATIVRVWDELPAIANDEDAFGVHLAERAASAPLGLAGQPVLSAATLHAGLERLLAFERVMHDVRHSSLEVTGEKAVLRHDPAGLRMPRHAIEFAWAWFVLIARRVTGANIVPTSVAFGHAAPAARGEHARVFGVAPRFDATATELHLARTDLERASRGADPALGSILESHARLLHAQLPASTDLLDQARAAIHAAMLAGEPTLANVAARMDTTERTLQRRLQERETSLAELLDELRAEIAKKWLGDPTVAIAEIAFGLGFAEVSAFHRAFVRWTGTTPGKFRRASA